MTKKLKCPFCGTELENELNFYDKPTDNYFCPNEKCKIHDKDIPESVWALAISAKKAQRQLRTVKDRCVKKIKAKEFEIHNCLYGIHVRDCEIETLQEKLSQAQNALNYAIDVLDNLTEIGGVDMEIIKIKEMAGIK